MLAILMDYFNSPASITSGICIVKAATNITDYERIWLLVSAYNGPIELYTVVSKCISQRSQFEVNMASIFELLFEDICFFFASVVESS